MVYRKDKVSTRPGPGAQEVVPSRYGEDYSYVVPKFWKVAGVPDPDHVVVVTRTGKHHHLTADDPHLHKASLFERLKYRHRFPRDVESGQATPDLSDTSRT